MTLFSLIFRIVAGISFIVWIFNEDKVTYFYYFLALYIVAKDLDVK